MVPWKAEHSAFETNIYTQCLVFIEKRLNQLLAMVPNSSIYKL